jgi:hypothetical protein
LEIDNRVLGKQGQHVIEKGDARPDLRASLAVDIQCQGNVGFLRSTSDLGAPLRHRDALNQNGEGTQSQSNAGA